MTSIAQRNQIRKKFGANNDDDEMPDVVLSWNANTWGNGNRRQQVARAFYSCTHANAAIAILKNGSNLIGVPTRNDTFEQTYTMNGIFSFIETCQDDTLGFGWIHATNSCHICNLTYNGKTIAVTV